MFPNVCRPDAPTARTSRGPVRRGASCWRGTNAGRSPTSTAATAFARHLAGQGVTAGDRVAVMTSNRVEFLVAVNGISKLGAAAVLLSPAWKAVEVDHDGLDRPPPRRGRGRTAPLLAEHVGGAVTDLDDPATAEAIPRPEHRPGCPGPTWARPTRPSSCSARARPGCPRPCATPATMATATADWVGRWASAPTTASRWPPALAHPRAAQPAGRHRGRRHRPAAPAFDLEEVLRASRPSA